MRWLHNIIIVLIMLAIARISFAGDAGQESPFSVGVGARALGLGGGFTSFADDASAIYYNPAGLPNLDFQEVSLMHMDLFEGTIYNFAGWAYPNSKQGGFGFAYLRIGTDDIIRRNNFIESGQFDYSHSQLLISYGQKIYSGLSAGLSFKIVNQSLDNLSDYGFGFDLGLMANIKRYLSAGVIIRDLIPSELELETSSEITPITVAGGLALRNLELSDYTNLSASVELEKIEHRSLKIHTGVEIIFDNNYTVRAGYDRDNISFGAGLKYHRLKLDYAYKVLDYIDDSHRISLSFLIGSSVSKAKKKKELLEQQLGTDLLQVERNRQFDFYKEKADEYYNQQRFDSALVYYQRSLAFDEDNQEIIEIITAIENTINSRQAEQLRIERAQLDLGKLIISDLTQAKNFFNKKYYRAALDMLDLIFEIKPDHTEAGWLKRSIEDAITKDIALELESAHKSELRGNYLRALESYNRILELDSTNQKARIGREQVISNLDIAQQLNKGIEYFNAANYDKARGFFNAVLSIDKQNTAALEYLKKIDIAEAKPTTLEDLQKDKIIWKLYLDGMRYMRKKEYEKAIESWNKVLEVYPNNINTLNNIEQARLRLKSEQSK